MEEQAAVDFVHENGQHVMDPGAIERGGLNHSALEALLLDPGTLGGHVIPGLMLLLFGFLWTFNILYKYHVARKGAILLGRSNYTLHYRSRLFSTHHTGHCTNSSVEAYVMVICTTLGFIGEIIMGFSGGEFVVISNTHHMCMYFFYGLTALTHILMCRKHPIPADSDYAMFIVACIVKALLFQGHVNGREPINAQVHMFLVYAILLTTMFTLMELAAPRNVLPSLGRTFCILVQGYWFCTAGFILYPPSFMPTWDDHNRAQMALLPTLFVVNIAVTCVSALAINYVVASRVNSINAQTISRILNNSEKRGPHTLLNNETGKPLISDSDCEC
ncbi:transmembrane protein 45A [Hyalella azteca]|uniref:Transmembrane protein 45A n=1 Tax=Hyalella azteca TaxID=294128 RepID=A0A8B7N411_HYAAZ|nr:transmembrane protein 45A [Hyalella azteca]